MDGFFGRGGFPFGNLGGMHGHGMDDRQKVQEWCEILDVNEGCTERELTQAWRRFVRKNHPDKGGDPDLFKNGQAAYEGLQERKKSTTVGRRGREPKPDAITHQLRIDLEDVCEGGSKTVEVTIKVAEERNVCPKCNGKGSETKIVRHGPVMMQTQSHCSRCQGQGISYVGERREANQVDVYIPPGTKQGDKLTASEEGHNLPGMARGDVIFVVNIKPHSIYKRIQADLAMTKELDLISALQGYDFTIPSIKRGEWLQVKSENNEIAQPGDVICVEGHGLPQKGSRGVRGNLYIRFNIILPAPNSLNSTQIESLQKVLSPSRIKYNMPGEEMNETREFTEGSKVRLTGLQNQPDLNGLGGRIVKENFRPETHAVLLENGKTVAVREEMLEFATKQKTKKKKKAQKPKKDEYCQIVTGVKVDDPDNIQYTENGHDDEEHEGHRHGGGVDCQQM